MWWFNDHEGKWHNRFILTLKKGDVELKKKKNEEKYKGEEWDRE